MMEPTAAIFIDRDGTINEDIGYVSGPQELVIYPWAAEAIRLINQAGLKVIVITNQSGIARGYYSEEMLAAIHRQMLAELARAGARIDAIYYCPHHPNFGGPRYQVACECRKPQPGMLYQAAREHRLDLARSFVIGDKASDIMLAQSVGARSALVLTGYGRRTLANRDLYPCEPDIVADDLLEAVKLILSR
ncbi:MAG TPA: D-glycero-beta-D-manno-heptose 1,7-bisphosphate 7-phosphatase [Blastocatellia bacterium]|nr:D-glycero-beta-D-manno-heptose 1,7-bisphosphate 7-phosphatase [Blastocatellia bacterium]